MTTPAAAALAKFKELESYKKLNKAFIDELGAELVRAAQGAGFTVNVRDAVAYGQEQRIVVTVVFNQERDGQYQFVVGSFRAGGSHYLTIWEDHGEGWQEIDAQRSEVGSVNEALELVFNWVQLQIDGKLQRL